MSYLVITIVVIGAIGMIKTGRDILKPSPSDEQIHISISDCSCPQYYEPTSVLYAIGSALGYVCRSIVGHFLFITGGSILIVLIAIGLRKMGLF